MLKRWLLIAATLMMAAFALAFVACDDDDDGGDAATATEAGAETPEVETPAATEEGTPAAAAPLDVTMNPVGDSQVTGTANIDTDGTTTTVLVEITAGLEAGTMHQSHIHHGNCSDPTGEIHVNLNNVEGQADGSGTASTEDPESLDGSGTPPFDHWTAREHYVAVHAADGSVIGCGDVPGAAA